MYKSTEYLTSEKVPHLIRHQADFSAMNHTDNAPRLQSPRHWTRGAMEKCFCDLLRNQEIFTHDFWSAFQSLGYRLDQFDGAMGIVRDRLWKIEHSPRRNHEEEQEEGSVLSGLSAQGPGGRGGIRFASQGRGDERPMGWASDPRKDAGERAAAGRRSEVTLSGERLMEQAREQYGEICPCSGKPWEDCFSVAGGKLVFRFNTADGHTHVLREDLLGEDGHKARP